MISPAGGDVVYFFHPGMGEPLIMAEVEVRLRPVVGDINLAMLKRVHGAGIDVDIGIEFEEGDF